MNTLKIKLNPYKDINIASLDERPLSPYSELNNYLKEPFLKWADKLLEAAEREINDDYSLVVSGESFETAFLDDMQNEFDACMSYSVEPYQLNYSVNDRYDFIKQLAAKYGVQVLVNNFRMPIYTEIQLSVNETMVCPATSETAFLFVTQNPALVQQIMEKNGPAIVVLISDTSKVTPIADMKYQWEITENRLSDVIDIIVDRFVKIPIISYVANQLNSISNQLNEEDSVKLALATEIDMFITVADVDPIAVGDLAELVIKTVPESAVIPAIRIESSNAGVVAVEETKLKAMAPGQAFIDIYKADELIPFCRKQVITTQDNFVKKIELAFTVPKMGIGRTQKVSSAFIPEDADDIALVEWASSDEGVISVDPEGNITAISPGKATITAATTRVKASIDVEVLPNLSSISLSTSKVELYVGQTEPMQVLVSPSNAFDTTCEWQSSDKSVAIVDILDDGSQVIRATGIGDCILTCVAKEGGCTATCSVKVESTFKKRENLHTFLSYTAIAAVACFICAVVYFKIGVIAAAAVTVFMGITSIGKNKKDLIWAIVLILFVVFLALDTLGM
nr:Ig-like domain-containing protein [uncultured Agathobacter sp.]